MELKGARVYWPDSKTVTVKMSIMTMRPLAVLRRSRNLKYLPKPLSTKTPIRQSQLPSQRLPTIPHRKVMPAHQANMSGGHQKGCRPVGRKGQMVCD